MRKEKKTVDAHGGGGGSKNKNFLSQDARRRTQRAPSQLHSQRTEVNVGRILRLHWLHYVPNDAHGAIF